MIHLFYFAFIFIDLSEKETTIFKMGFIIYKKKIWKNAWEKIMRGLFKKFLVLASFLKKKSLLNFEGLSGLLRKYIKF